MDGIREPVPQPLLGDLRRAVLSHALAERRRVHQPLLHVGSPGGVETVFPASAEPVDHALRCDVVAAMVRRTTRADVVPMVWLTRPGDLVLEDVDADWLTSALTAYGETGLPLTMVIVNRHGWRDPRSGVSRSWKRLRQR